MNDHDWIDTAIEAVGARAEMHDNERRESRIGSPDEIAAFDSLCRCNELQKKLRAMREQYTRLDAAMCMISKRMAAVDVIIKDAKS